MFDMAAKKTEHKGIRVFRKAGKPLAAAKILSIRYNRAGRTAVLLSTLLLLLLAGCASAGGFGKSESPAVSAPEPMTAQEAADAQEESSQVTLYEKWGLTVAIPNEWLGRLLVFPEPDFEMLKGTYLISVYEKQSYEESRADYGGEDGAGYLFSIARYTQAQYEQFLGSDGSGQSFFAKDDTYYFGWFVPTDVQFYRSEKSIDTESDEWKDWVEINKKCLEIRSDFLTRNNLQAYSDSEFTSREFTYDGAHKYLTYYPYYAYPTAAKQQGFGWQDVPYTLVLSQPAAQGEGGIWCVERWYDDNGNLYYEFPDESGLCAREYYANLQSAADRGEETFRLFPEKAALEFVQNEFDHTLATEESFAPLDGEIAANVLPLCREVFANMEKMQAAAYVNGKLGYFSAFPLPEYYDRPFNSAVSSRLYPILWLHAEKPKSFSGGVVICRGADAGKTVTFYEQDSLVCVNTDGMERWFKPAYSYRPTVYARMYGFYEEFSRYDNEAPRHSYGDAEAQAACDTVYALFQDQFPGCTLTRLSYDPARSYQAAGEYLKSGRGSGGGYAIDHVIVLFASFTTDGKQTSLRPDSTYEDYRFVLVREDSASAWTVDQWGD